VKPARTSLKQRYAMLSDTTVIAFRQLRQLTILWSDLARPGARRMLAQVLIAEADSFVAVWKT
jgi:putative transposase